MNRSWIKTNYAYNYAETEAFISTFGSNSKVSSKQSLCKNAEYGRPAYWSPVNKVGYQTDAVLSRTAHFVAIKINNALHIKCSAGSATKNCYLQLSLNGINDTYDSQHSLVNKTVNVHYRHNTTCRASYRDMSQ